MGKLNSLKHSTHTIVDTPMGTTHTHFDCCYSFVYFIVTMTSILRMENDSNQECDTSLLR